MRHHLPLAFLILLVGCKPSHPPPEGFVESCYGGDFAKHHNGNTPRISIRVGLAESDWPGLADSLRRYSVQHKLDFFDTTMRLDHVHALGLNVCSAKGVYISAHEQLWKSNPESDHDPGHTTVTLYSFKRLDTTALEDSLAEHLKERYADAEVNRLAAVRGPNTSLERTRER